MTAGEMVQVANLPDAQDDSSNLPVLRPCQQRVIDCLRHPNAGVEEGAPLDRLRPVSGSPSLPVGPSRCFSSLSAWPTTSSPRVGSGGARTSRYCPRRWRPCISTGSAATYCVRRNSQDMGSVATAGRMITGVRAEAWRTVGSRCMQPPPHLGGGTLAGSSVGRFRTAV